MQRHFDKDIEELKHLLLRMGAMVTDSPRAPLGAHRPPDVRTRALEFQRELDDSLATRVEEERITSLPASAPGTSAWRTARPAPRPARPA